MLFSTFLWISRIASGRAIACNLQLCECASAYIFFSRFVFRALASSNRRDFVTSRLIKLFSRSKPSQPSQITALTSCQRLADIFCRLSLFPRENARRRDQSWSRCSSRSILLVSIDRSKTKVSDSSRYGNMRAYNNGSLFPDRSSFACTKLLLVLQTMQIPDCDRYSPVLLRVIGAGLKRIDLQLALSHGM